MVAWFVSQIAPGQQRLIQHGRSALNHRGEFRPEYNGYRVVGIPLCGEYQVADIDNARAVGTARSIGV